MRVREVEFAEQEQKLINYNRMIEALNRDDDELWRFRPAVPPQRLMTALAGSGVPVVTFANLKGGVGKTTTAANLGAYFDRHGFRVLLIDLDYQGSLTGMILRAVGEPRLERSLADPLLSGIADGEWVLKHARPLGNLLPNTRLLTAGYTLAMAENRLMLRWLAGLIDADVRFNLLRALMSDAVLSSFDIVLIDAAPRLTTGTINALTASTHFVVPTILDDLSTETLPSFLRQANVLFRQSLNTNLQLAGVLATMTDAQDLRDYEKISLAGVRESVAGEWGHGGHIFDAFIPDRVAVARSAGKRLAYFDETGENSANAFFSAVGDELVSRIGLRTVERIGRVA